MDTKFKKGQTAWNKNGKYISCVVCDVDIWVTPCTEGRRKTCSYACKGKAHKPIFTPESREKISKTHLGKKQKHHRTGENHWNWQGGITNPSKAQRMKFRRDIQSLVLKRDNYTCVICDSSGGNLQVDHIKKWSDYPELRFDINNCRTLCMACHYYVTFKRKIPKGVVWGHNLKRRHVS